VLLDSAGDQGTFTAKGAIRLCGADITGQLNMSGARLNGANTDGNALNAEGIKVGGAVLLESLPSCDKRTFTAKGAIRLLGADITGQLAMRGARLNAANTDGNALVADWIKVGGAVFLDSAGDQGTFTAKGAIRLASADITGELNMSGARLNGANTDGNALDAEGIKVGGDVYLGSAGDKRTFAAKGAIRLFGADITGQLNMSGARLNGANTDGNALDAEGIKVGGGVFLQSLPSGDKGTFAAKGAIRLLGADITGQLCMRGARLNGADNDGDAVVADWIKVGGAVFLDSAGDQGTFTAKGAIRLASADIAGQLVMHGARLNAAVKDGNALTAFRMKVGDDVYLGDRMVPASSGDQSAFTATGTLWLVDARLGASLSLAGAELAKKAVALNAEGIQITRKLFWRPARPVLGQVNLEGAAAGELDDDWTGTRLKQNGYWPPDTRLDGFIYTAIGADNKASVNDRLHWIRGKNKGKTRRCSRSKGTTSDADAGAVFASGPYEQLFQVYQRAGNDTDARKVAIAERRDQRKLGRLRWHRKIFNQLLDYTIGYGFQTWRALIGLAGLYAFVLVVSLIALHHNGSIVPVPQNAIGILPQPHCP